MIFNDFKISQVTESDLNSISLLHKSAFSDMHLTKFLPISVIEGYYSIFLSNNVHFNKLTVNSVVHGFIVFGNTTTINSCLRDFKKKYIFNIFLLFFKKPILFFKVLFKYFVNHDLSDYTNDDVILSVVSSKKYNGIGKCLVQSSVLDINDDCDLYLYVNSNEISTINFYLNIGFHLDKRVNIEYIMLYKN